MRKFAIAGIAALAIAGSTAVYAQHHRWFHEHVRMSPEDRAAFTDARIAAVKAGLKLPPTRKSCGRRSRPRCGISQSCGSIAPMRG